MEKWAKKFRALAFALIFSGALNIGLLIALIFFSLKEKPNEFSPRGVPQKEERVSLQLLSSMGQLSFQELVSFLTNKQPVEEGYLKRDLALASLVAFHDFDLGKALSGLEVSHRTLSLTPNQQVEVFPDLTESQFQTVIQFAYEEKWPLTSKGLHRLLKKRRDPSLEQAFLITPQFHAVQELFQKSGAPQDSSILIDLVCEGTWDVLDRFSKEQEQIFDFSGERRAQLLLSYLTLQSPTAAHLLLETDFSFTLKRLSDAAVLELLRLLDHKFPEFERYCLELLRSSRADAVLQSAAQRLYELRGWPLPESFDLRTALTHFGIAVQQTLPLPIQSAYRVHVVQEGENLWKIARQYGLKLDELVQLNELEKEQIFPGMVLRVGQN